MICFLRRYDKINVDFVVAIASLYKIFFKFLFRVLLSVRIFYNFIIFVFFLILILVKLLVLFNKGLICSLFSLLKFVTLKFSIKLIERFVLIFLIILKRLTLIVILIILRIEFAYKSYCYLKSLRNKR